MAPKKKARGPSRPASSPSANAIEDAPFTKDTSAKTGARFPLLQDDGWTDDQESVLFKGMIRWKPVGWAISSPFSTALTKSPRGVHKHFRIIAISQYLQSHGYTPLEHEHTRIPHIWKKLESLYNLEALDDRENAFSRASSPDTEGTEMPSHQFTLPHDDFGKMMFERRLAPEGSSSPPASTRPPSAGSTSAAATGRASTIEDTEDLRSSPASAHGARTTGSNEVGTQAAGLNRNVIQLTRPMPKQRGLLEKTEKNTKMYRMIRRTLRKIGLLVEEVAGENNRSSAD
ncbi:MAG: hypothetical protein Q9205_005433 [Flavoplaca limonia]